MGRWVKIQADRSDRPRKVLYAAEDLAWGNDGSSLMPSEKEEWDGIEKESGGGVKSEAATPVKVADPSSLSDDPSEGQVSCGSHYAPNCTMCPIDLVNGWGQSGVMGTAPG